MRYTLWEKSVKSMPRRASRAEPGDPARSARQLLEARTAQAVAVLVELMQDEGQKPELRMKAAESILDRVCGKAASGTQAAGEGATVAVQFEGVLEEWSQ